MTEMNAWRMSRPELKLRTCRAGLETVVAWRSRAMSPRRPSSAPAVVLNEEPEDEGKRPRLAHKRSLGEKA